MSDVPAVRRVLLSGLVFMGTTTGCFAQAEFQHYCARLSEDDHVDSRGEPLSSVGAVVQQDRANYHVRHLRDGEDEPDPIFADGTSRASLQERIDAGELSAADKRKILDGTPLVCVTIEGDTATLAIEK